MEKLLLLFLVLLCLSSSCFLASGASFSEIVLAAIPAIPIKTIGVYYCDVQVLGTRLAQRRTTSYFEVV
jgi:hypothetical protein